jgi:hypothetical protein
MAMMCRLLVRAVLCVLAVIAGASALFAQNVFSIRFDTVTAKGGDTVTVNAYYTFSATGAHDINNFTAQLDYDSTEARLLGFVIGGTASAAFDTTARASHRGLTVGGGQFDQEIDLTNPVLFGIRFLVNRQLADTAFVQWDTNVTMFDSASNVNQVIYKNGWMRTLSTAGHVVIQTPGKTIKGITEGYSPDSVFFELPFVVSNLNSAKMTSARLTFTYDSTVLSWDRMFDASSESLAVDSIGTTVLLGGLQQCTIVLASQTGVIKGSDTLVNLKFAALVGLDTVCEALTNVTLRPVNSDASIGNTGYFFDSICLEGTVPSEVASVNAPSGIKMYPNPARDRVTIDGPGNADELIIEAYDVVGRLSFSGHLMLGEWQIPPGIEAGAYEIVLSGGIRGLQTIGTLIVALR